MKFPLATLVTYFLLCLITAQDYETGNTKSTWSSKGGSGPYAPRQPTLENVEPATQLTPARGNPADQPTSGRMFIGTNGAEVPTNSVPTNRPTAKQPTPERTAFIKINGSAAVRGGAKGGGEEGVSEPETGAPAVGAPGFGVGGVFVGAPTTIGGGPFLPGRPAPQYDDGNYAGSRKTFFGKGRRWRGPRCSVEPPHEECTGGITMWFYDPENKTCAAHEVGNCFKLGFFFCRACVASCMGIFWRRREIQEICQLAD